MSSCDVKTDQVAGVAITDQASQARVAIQDLAVVFGTDKYFQIALRSLLKNPIETSSFEEALQQVVLAPEAISVLVLDFPMPSMETKKLSLVKKICSKTRVVVVSSSNRRDDVFAALNNGVHGYIPKRLAMTEIGNALAQVIAGNIYVPASIVDLELESAQSQSVISLPYERDKRMKPSLTPRQEQILELLVQGKSNKEICRILNLCEGTVKIHVAGVFRALAVSRRAAAAVVGARLLMEDVPLDVPPYQYRSVPGAA